MITPIEIIRKTLIDELGTGVPVMTRIPEQRPELFILVSQDIPVNTMTVHDRTFCTIRVYTTDLDLSLELINKVRRRMWNVQDDDTLSWEETQGPFPAYDPDLSDHEVWQIGGYIYQMLR